MKPRVRCYLKMADFKFTHPCQEAVDLLHGPDSIGSENPRIQS